MGGGVEFSSSLWEKQTPPSPLHQKNTEENPQGDL